MTFSVFFFFFSTAADCTRFYLKIQVYSKRDKVQDDSPRKKRTTKKKKVSHVKLLIDITTNIRGQIWFFFHFFSVSFLIGKNDFPISECVLKWKIDVRFPFGNGVFNNHIHLYYKHSHKSPCKKSCRFQVNETTQTKYERIYRGDKVKRIAVSIRK